MAADLSIHVLVPPCTEETLAQFFQNTLGSKYFSWFAPNDDGWREAHNVVAATPSFWIGEVSWLKAGLFDDAETYVPDPVAKVQEIIGENLPVIDDQLINQLEEALNAYNQTSYSVANDGVVLRTFLESHRGKPVFTVSW
jgi:hypothetical protein